MDKYYTIDTNYNYGFKRIESIPNYTVYYDVHRNSYIFKLNNLINQKSKLCRYLSLNRFPFSDEVDCKLDKFGRWSKLKDIVLYYIDRVNEIITLMPKDICIIIIYYML